MDKIREIVRNAKKKLLADNGALLKKIGLNAAIALLYGANERQKGMKTGYNRGYEKGVNNEWTKNYNNLIAHAKAEVPYAFEDEDGKYHKFYPDSLVNNDGWFNKKL